MGFATPEPSWLALELRQVVKHGANATKLAGDAAELSTLLGLDCLGISQPMVYDRAQALVRVLGAAVKRQGTPTGQALALLLGLAPGTSGLPASRRRGAAADELFGAGAMTAATFQRRHQDELLNIAADELYRMEQEYRARAVRSRLERQDPVESHLAFDWLERFEDYYRMWTALSGLANDLMAFLTRRCKDPEDSGLGSYQRSSLWYYARFLVALARFEADRGGLWLLADAEEEQAVAEAVYLISWHPPLSDLDQSRLRLILDAAPANELAAFIEALDISEPGEVIQSRWNAWVAGCHCHPDTPKEECEVHRVIGQCHRYMKLVDDNWYRIADWYQRAPSGTGFSSEDLVKLFGRFPYHLKEFDRSRGNSRPE